MNKLHDIDVLVNNVGTLYKICDYFLQIPKTCNDSYINVNTVSATKMIEIVLPKMVEKRRGIIINISSAVAAIQMPLFATYASSETIIYFNYLFISFSNQITDYNLIEDKIKYYYIGSEHSINRLQKPKFHLSRDIS